MELYKLVFKNSRQNLFGSKKKYQTEKNTIIVITENIIRENNELNLIRKKSTEDQYRQNPEKENTTESETSVNNSSNKNDNIGELSTCW